MHKRNNSKEKATKCLIDSSLVDSASFFLSKSPSLPFSFPPFQVNLRNSEHLLMTNSCWGNPSVLVYAFPIIINYQVPYPAYTNRCVLNSIILDYPSSRHA